MLKHTKFVIALLLSTVSISSVADTIINNYPAAAAPQQQVPQQAPVQAAPTPSCGSYSSGGGTPPGTYQTKNSDGSVNTIYTTGDKQPYMVDNTCNQQQPIIQPYVYPNVPYNNGGGPVNPNPRPVR